MIYFYGVVKKGAGGIMAFLEESEWLFVNEIAYNISFIYAFDDMRHKLLDWIGKLIPYDCACFSLVKDDAVYNTVSIGINEKNIAVYEKLYGDSPLYWTLISGESFAYNQGDVLSADSVKDNIFYKNFLKKNGFAYSMGINIVFKDEAIGVINLYRVESKGDFCKRDLFILNVLRKHLAYRLFYEAKKGDARFLFAEGYKKKISSEFGLTRRESEVLNYAVKGFSNDEIAAMLNISVSTVKKHFNNLYKKMHVKNRVQLLQSVPLSTNKINFDEL